jgi:hypothetical protein
MVVIAGSVLLALTLLRFFLGKRCEPLRDRLTQRRHQRRVVHLAAHRPIELIARDLHRLGWQYHHLDPRTPFVKADAVRAAYDHRLAECCASLGVVNLLEVLEPGPQLDAERGRVERQLAASGMRLAA